MIRKKQGKKPMMSDEFVNNLAKFIWGYGYDDSCWIAVMYTDEDGYWFEIFANENDGRKFCRLQSKRQPLSVCGLFKFSHEPMVHFAYAKVDGDEVEVEEIIH